jgi:hypothetical protein
MKTKNFKTGQIVRLPDGRIGKVLGQEPVGEYRIEVDPSGEMEWWFDDQLEEAEPIKSTAYYAERGEW